jgi:uncharacterized damage-inducible protein DinB
MSLKQQFELLAAYNQRMNFQFYEAASRLSGAELAQDRGAYFGSILGTLNHILVGDIIWLKRFATHPSCLKTLSGVTELPNPISLNQILYPELTALSEHRVWLDIQVINWVREFTDTDLNFILNYRNTKGLPCTKIFSSLVLHFFNHQTHHRGQVSTLLSQAGENVGVTDLLALIPEETNV